MISPANLRANLLVKLGERTGRTHALPLVLFAPTARCNSRCQSCDWWRADGKSDLSLDEIRALAAELPRFGTRVVVLTGGEPLVRPDVMAVADLFRARRMTLQLLTSGLALERYARDIGERFQTVTVSLDGHTSELYRAIRGVNGLDAVVSGVRALRAAAPRVAVWGRSTIHRLNFRHLPDLVAKSRDIGLDYISFLPADVSSDAFNHQPSLPRAADDGAPPRLLLDRDEVAELDAIVEATILSFAREIEQGKVASGASGLRGLVRYYRAHADGGPFAAPDCNAPWASVFIEANGAVRPCFFHPPVGNLRERPLAELLNAAMPAFRRGLDVASNAICARCVCSLKVSLRSKLW